MKRGGALTRRVVKLECVRRPSAESKLETVQRTALAETSDIDLKLLEQIKALELAGRMNDASSEQLLAVDRYKEAYENALVTAGPSFSVAEMNQFLGAE
jgi:hypothetical protein